MRELFRQLRNIYRYYRVPKQSFRRNDVFNAVGRLTQWNPNVKIMALDGSYLVTDLASWERTLGNFWESQKDYIGDTYDCDDFAFWMKAWASGMGITGVGVVIDNSAVHAYNVGVLNFGGQLIAQFIEPQTGLWVEKSDPSGLYRCEEGTILI